MIRIKDIADEIGVSATTVSNVIHGKDQRVSKDTKEKIERALKEKGYVPRMSALMLARDHSGMIGVVINKRKDSDSITLEDPYFSSLVGYLEYFIRKNGRYMLIIAEQDEEEIIKQAYSWNLEGLIVCNRGEEELLDLSRHYNGSLISVDTYLSHPVDFIHIMTDDFSGGYQMAKYLISRGKKKISMVADNDYGVDHYRWLGFREAMVEEKLEITKDSRIIISTDYEERIEEYKNHLAFYRSREALFFASDYYALEASSFFMSMGIHIPNDLSIAGFDHLLYARLLHPRLTTIHQAIDQKAEMAVNALLEQIRQKEIKDKKRELPVKLIIGESTN